MIFKFNPFKKVERKENKKTLEKLNFIEGKSLDAILKKVSFYKKNNGGGLREGSVIRIAKFGNAVVEEVSTILVNHDNTYRIE